MNITAKNRLAGLEVIRGLAALSVVLFHLNVMHVHLPPGLLDTFVRTFSGAVPIFFALSAFSLLFGYDNKLHGERALTRFYVRRIFRILPLFYAILIVNIALDIATGVWVSRSEVIINLLFLFPFFPGKHESMVWAGWSLGVECAFYVIFPAAALLARSLRISCILLVAFALVNLAIPVIVANAGLSKSFASMSIPSNLLYFQAGVATFALALALTEKPAFERWKTYWEARRTAFLLASFLMILLLRLVETPSSIILTVACCTWIFCAYCGLPSWLDNQPFRFFGRLSYGIYLIHPLVLYYATKLGFYTYIGRIVQNPVGTFLACAIVTLPVVILLAYLGHRVIEAPGIRAGERLLAATPKPRAIVQ